MFNIIDVFFLITIGLFCYIGIKNGIITSLFFVLSGFLGIFISYTIDHTSLSKFYVLFIVITTTLIMLSLVIKRFIKSMLLNPLDRLGGLILGFTLGLLVFTIIVVTFLDHRQNLKIIKESYFGRHILSRIEHYIPDIDNINLKKISKDLIISD